MVKAAVWLGGLGEESWGESEGRGKFTYRLVVPGGARGGSVADALRPAVAAVGNRTEITTVGAVGHPAD